MITVKLQTNQEFSVIENIILHWNKYRHSHLCCIIQSWVFISAVALCEVMSISVWC